MGFNPNKTPIKIIKEGAFGGTNNLKTFILVLVKSDTKIDGMNLFI